MNNNKIMIFVVAFAALAFLAYNGTINIGGVMGPKDNDTQAATAAVGLGGGLFVDGTNGPSPSPSPNVKPHQKDCTVCKGTGYIRNGDGNVTKCTNCVPNNSGDALEDSTYAILNYNRFIENERYEKEAAAEAKAAEEAKIVAEQKVVEKFVCKTCGEGCTCVECKCQVGGNCEAGCKCELCKKEVKIEAAPELSKDDFDNTLTSKKIIREASRAFAAKDYIRSGELMKEAIAAAKNDEAHGSSAELDSVKRSINKGKNLLKAKGVHVEPVYVFEKDKYDTFVAAYNKYVETQKARVESLKQTIGEWESYSEKIKAQQASSFSMGFTGDCSGGSCSGGSCGSGSGYGGFFMQGGSDGGSCSGGSCGSGGGGCSGGSCGGGRGFF